MSEKEQLKQAIEYAVSAGYQLDLEAFQFLSTIAEKENPTNLMEQAIKYLRDKGEKQVFIGKELLEKIAKEKVPSFFEEQEKVALAISETTVISQAKRRFKPLAREIPSKIKVIEDPTDKISATGELEEYLEYFRDRFNRLRKILLQRMDTRDAVNSIRLAYSASPNTRLKIIGMITEKKETKQKILLKIEDLDTSITVLVPRNASRQLMEKARLLLHDQVICVSAVKLRNNLLIAEDIIFPDIPQRTPKKASEPLYAVLISDLHVGSKTFLREEFRNFILWLNGKYGNAKMREIAGQVKYLVVAGDIVDGIGVYPEQLKELLIPDIYKQYELASMFFEQIPDYIEVIVIPGNHDASRKALPQPALSREYAEPLYEKRPLKMLGNPAVVELHGVEFLLYHGRSIDDVVVSAPNISFQQPEKAMRLLLWCRHLAPIYGAKTPIAPETKDFLVIERIPDVFHSGHVHVMKYENYRGTLLVNSGTWQEKTLFQEKMGLEPTPGIVPIVNLQTLEVQTISFI